MNISLFLTCASTEGGRKEKIDESVMEEIRIGRSLAARLTAKYGLMMDEPTTRYLNMLGATIGSLSSRPEITYRFGILDSEEVNAFACPGGYVLISAGAIKSMENEAELAFVLAHEISHVVLNHSNIKPKRKAGIIEFIATFLGGGGAVMNMAIEQASSELEKVLLENGRQKELELEADKSGFIYSVVGMGYDYNASINYLNRIAAKSKEKGHETRTKTHPPFSERISVIQALASNQNLAATQKFHVERFQSFIASMPAIGQTAAAQRGGNEKLIKEVGVGRAVGSELAKKYGILKSINATKYLNLLAQSFVEIRAIRPEVDYYIGILDSDEIATFAAPGGYIFITKGALKNIQNESELAFVIGRAMVHIALKHPLTPRSTGLFSRMLDSDNLLDMDTDSAVEKTMKILTEVGRDPNKEIAADRSTAFYIALGMGYDYNSAIQYMKRIAAKSENNTLFQKTLPASEQRIQAITDFATKQSLIASGKLNAERFNQYIAGFDNPANLDKTKVQPPDKKLVRELQLGRALAANLTKKYGLVEKVRAARYMNLLAKTATSFKEERPKIDYYFGILDSQQIMAYGCPGGYILVTEGALKAVKNEAELMFLLAREMSHVQLRHSLGEQVVGGGVLSKIKSVFSSSLLDETGSVRPAVKQLTEALTDSGRPESEELEADINAILHISMKMGYDYASAIELLKRIDKEEENAKQIKSLMPDLSKRIEMIETFAKQQSLLSPAKRNESRFAKYMGTI